MNPSNHTRNCRSQKSVTVRVKLCDFLSKLTLENDFDIPVPVGCTIAEFIEHLVVRLGDEFRKTLLDNNGRPHPEYAIVLNKHLIPPQELTQFSIRESSKLSIIPIAGGG